MCPLLVTRLLSLSCQQNLYLPVHQPIRLPPSLMPLPIGPAECSLHSEWPGYQLQLFQGQRLRAWGRVRTMGWGIQREQEESEEGVWDSFHACHKIFSHMAERLPFLWPSAVAWEARKHQGNRGIWVPTDLGIYPLLSLSLPPAGGAQQPWVSQ